MILFRRCLVCAYFTRALVHQVSLSDILVFIISTCFFLMYHQSRLSLKQISKHWRLFSRKSIDMLRNQSEFISISSIQTEAWICFKAPFLHKTFSYVDKLIWTKPLFLWTAVLFGHIKTADVSNCYQRGPHCSWWLLIFQ